MHEFLRPNKGKYGLVDYEKVFTPVDDVDKDIFDLRDIDRGSGALVVVRPDQVQFRRCCRSMATTS